ncbi:hypothetical protein BGW41_005820 [Actinomortierella wolfii]|nr:hypothetical protein BGW41_005820 [Actinomortierella wolfii]
MSPQQPAVDMVALASAADAPFDSEVPFADLGNEAIVTIESASPRSNTGTLSPHTTVSTGTAQAPTSPSAADLESFFALDANFLALATSSSTPSSTSTPSSSSSAATQTVVGTVSPMALKLESPLLTPLTVIPAMTATATRGTATKTAAKRARTSTSSTSTSTTSKPGPRKRSQDPADKEARARERVLRNRAAAQESRDKKRKYVADIEASNAQLQEENSQLLKRLKTVEEDNQALSKRLEALTAQFEKIQQQLAMSAIQQTPGVGFCQSAVLAKKDGTQVSTNSLQQKLAPPPKKNLPRNSFLNTSKTHSMTVPSVATTKRPSLRTAPYPQRQAKCQSSEEICSRTFRLNSDRTLTLSSSTPACLLRVRVPPSEATAATVALIHQWLLPQLMLTSLTLFWISTGARSSSSSNSTTNSFSPSFLQYLPWLNPLRPSSNKEGGDATAKHGEATTTTTAAAATMTVPLSQSHTIRVSKDVINSLSPSSVQEILTEYRQGRHEAARRLLLKVLLSSTRLQ